MKFNVLKPVLLPMVLLCLLTTETVNAQLNNIFQNEFELILSPDRGAISTSPGMHGNHFQDAAMEAATNLSPVLERLIAGNISSFPLSSTAAGFSFDFSSGQPVSVSESLGPIFAETGRTLGKGKINFGINHTIANPTRFRGIKTEDIAFAFTHVDVSPNEGTILGASPNESDVLDVTLGLDLSVGITALYFTAGITDNLDISVALPLINLTVEGEITAVVNSFTWANLGVANHRFGGTDTDPELTYSNRYSRNAASIGDLAVRAKYNLAKGSGVNAAVMADVRIPTGDDANFLGTGDLNARFVGIISGKTGDFSPHLNLGYDYRGADLDSDELEFALGFDQKLAPGFTFALDILGEIDLNDDEALQLFPGVIPIEDRIKDADGNVVGTNLREIPRSNVPEDISDDVLNIAAGIRIAPSERLQILGNLLVPINNGGLRPDFAATFGISLSL